MKGWTQPKRSCSTATMSRARSLRMAHEMVERNTEPDSPLAIVGIHRRGVHPRVPAACAGRRADLGALALGSLDIAFYRDDLGRRPGGAGRPRLAHRLRRSTGATVVIVDDVLFTGRTVRAAIEALFDYGRPGASAARRAGRPRPSRAADPRPTTSARTCRPRSRERVNVRVAELDGVDEVTIADAGEEVAA